jgi:DNA-binding response OmpR family regulator
MGRFAFLELSQLYPGVALSCWLNTGRMRILVVDDDQAVRESLRRSLEFNGYTVELAQDGQQAMDAVARQRPDAMVLDMMMPRVDGLEVCRRLRSAGDDLPVLVLTARDAVSDRVAGLDAGADDYLPKPFLLEELLARLRALLRRTTIDRLGDPGAVLTFVDNDPSAYVADSHGSPIEVSVRGVKRVTSSRPVKSHVSLKTRLSTKVIGVASIVVAVIGLIPPFAGTFWIPDTLDSKARHSNAASCIKIGNIFFVNGIPEAMADIRVLVDVRAAGRRYAYWLVLTLILTDGSVRTEERRIEEVPGIVIFPLDFLPVDAKRHNLMVDVDIVGATDVPVGSCL